jgi:hypothetical protein
MLAKVFKSSHEYYLTYFMDTNKTIQVSFINALEAEDWFIIERDFTKIKTYSIIK